jgi:O-acetylhomoserine (thiol)-lyase
MEEFHALHKASIGEAKLLRTLFSSRLRMRYLTDMGAHLSPNSAFNILQGMETLSLRWIGMHQTLQRWLGFWTAIRLCIPCHTHACPQAPMPPWRKGTSREDCQLQSVLSKVRILDYMVNVGDAKSLIVHCATSTHYGQPQDVQEAAGVYGDTLRISVGIEDPEDLIADLAQALEGA